jgi:uncharacterized membrane protein
MSDHRADIIEFLNANPETFFSRKEICKKAVHRSVIEEDAHWEIQPLAALVSEGQLEKNDAGHYRIKQSGYRSKANKYD